MKTHFLFSSFLILLFISCKSPFQTNTNPDDIFELTAVFNEHQRIVDTMTVKLEWTEITLENFKKIKISRFNKQREVDSYLPGETIDGWITLAEIENEFITSWIDTIKDDAPFKYRVEYFNTDNNSHRAEVEIMVKPTTSIIIPTDVSNVKNAIESYIIDDGDSVLLNPGIHSSHAFSFNEKRVHMLGKNGALETALRWLITLTPSGKMIHDSTFINIKHGTIKGLTIIDGYSYHGGAINASGDAIISQCRIKNNHAGILYNGGKGGGVYLSGNASLMNCIIDSNSADYFGDGIYIDEFAENVNIINCVLQNNNIFTASSNLNILNTIIVLTDNKIEYPAGSQPSVKYSHINNEWSVIDHTNITGDVAFTSFDPLDAHLLPNSACIDSGNPNPIYNDIDGSINDIGAFGGPSGDWY